MKVGDLYRRNWRHGYIVRLVKVTEDSVEYSVEFSYSVYPSSKETFLSHFNPVTPLEQVLE